MVLSNARSTCPTEFDSTISACWIVVVNFSSQPQVQLNAVGDHEQREARRGSIIDNSSIKTRATFISKTYGACMTKTLSKSKSTCGSKHGGTRKKGTHVTREGFRTYFGKAKKMVLGYYAINECGIYGAIESM